MMYNRCILHQANPILVVDEDVPILPVYMRCDCTDREHCTSYACRAKADWHDLIPTNVLMLRQDFWKIAGIELAVGKRVEEGRLKTDNLIGTPCPATTSHAFFFYCHSIVIEILFSYNRYYLHICFFFNYSFEEM